MSYLSFIFPGKTTLLTADFDKSPEVSLLKITPDASSGRISSLGRSQAIATSLVSE